MKTLNFNTLLKLAAAAGFLGFPVNAGATPPAVSGSSMAAGLAAAYDGMAAPPVKSLQLAGRALFYAGGQAEDKLVESEEGAERAKRVSRLQEPGEAMGGGEERKEAAGGGTE